MFDNLSFADLQEKKERNSSMANPEYHVRPYPQQPKKGNAKLIQSLADLQQAISQLPPNIKKLESIQASVHTASQHINDDKLVDLLRILAIDLEKYIKTVDEELPQKIFAQILKIRINLKHL